MGAIIKAGLLMGILVEVWTYIMGFTGWYKEPGMTFLFWVSSAKLLQRHEGSFLPVFF